jgi:DNA polymerase-3 subunit chi
VAQAPCEVWFYHLERAGFDEVLPDLLEKTLARGWRALVWCEDEARLAHLDALLWTWRDDSFLAHGLAQEPFAEAQPVLLATMPEPRNGAQALFAVDGDPGCDLAGFARCVVIFDGRSQDELAGARRFWSRCRREGLAATYWRQGETRGWRKEGQT